MKLVRFMPGCRSSKVPSTRRIRNRRALRRAPSQVPPTIVPARQPSRRDCPVRLRETKPSRARLALILQGLTATSRTWTRTVSPCSNSDQSPTQRPARDDTTDVWMGGHASFRLETSGRSDGGVVETRAEQSMTDAHDLWEALTLSKCV